MEEPSDSLHLVPHQNLPRSGAITSAVLLVQPLHLPRHLVVRQVQARLDPHHLVRNQLRPQHLVPLSLQLLLLDHRLLLLQPLVHQHLDRLPRLVQQRLVRLLLQRLRLAQQQHHRLLAEHLLRHQHLGKPPQPPRRFHRQIRHLALLQLPHRHLGQHLVNLHLAKDPNLMDLEDLVNHRPIRLPPHHHLLSVLVRLDNQPHQRPPRSRLFPAAIPNHRLPPLTQHRRHPHLVALAPNRLNPHPTHSALRPNQYPREVILARLHFHPLVLLSFQTTPLALQHFRVRLPPPYPPSHQMSKYQKDGHTTIPGRISCRPRLEQNLGER